MELVYKAPILVSILIAGADGNIDRKEIKEAILFAESKISTKGSSVSRFFGEVAQDFEDKLKIVLQQYPYESTQRNPLIIEELSQLNPLWSKMDKPFANEFYKTLLGISKKIASSSGGILGYNSVGSAEAKYLKLKMLNDPSVN